MKSQYDTHVPESLKSIQKWFGETIGHPIDENSCMTATTNAAQYIAPSPTLKPNQRIELYSQQYWWRLLDALQENFPFLTRLFGYTDFNASIGKPTLAQYPPTHWSLTMLGEQVPRWIDENYHENDRSLVLDAARIDWSMIHSFTARHHPSISIEQLQNLMTTPLYLQPHLHLFDLRGNLFSSRDKMIKEEGDYWMAHPFPEIEKSGSHTYVVYRNQNNHVSWLQLDKGDYFLLHQIQSGKTLQQACDHLAEDPELSKEATDRIALWSRRWILNNWITLQCP